MGLTSTVGRIMFASFFLIPAWQQFKGGISGSYMEAFKPKLEILTGHVASLCGLHAPEITIKYLVATTVAIKGLGGILFVLGCSYGAYLLLLYLAIITPIFFDFYNHSVDSPEFRQLFVKFVEVVALFGALLYFLEMKNSISIPKRQEHRVSKKKAPKLKKKQI